MTRIASAQGRIVILVSLVTAVFTLLAILPVQAQQKWGANQTPVKSSATPAIHRSIQSTIFVEPDGRDDLARRTATVRPGATPAGAVFSPAVVYDSGGQLASLVTVADLNGDGTPDLVVANGNSSTAGVLLGNGDGTFQPAGAYGTGGGPLGMAVGDLNGDGIPDLAVANQGCPGMSVNCVGILLGNGDGTFQPAVDYPDGGRGWASGEGIFFPIFIADVNGDGKPDVIVVNQTDQSYFDGSLSVLLGNGDGTFQPAVNYDSGGFGAFSGAVVDVNGDGKPDLIVVNCGPSGSTNCPSSAGSVGVLINNGNGTFQPVTTYSRGGWGWVFSPLVVADVNGDGKPDILVGNTCLVKSNCLGKASHNGSFGVLLNQGHGTFQPVVVHNSGRGEVVVMAVADLNGDGKPDLVLANDSVGVWLNRGKGRFRLSGKFPSHGTGQIHLIDLDGDGKIDYIGINGTSNSADVRLGNGNGTFQATQTFSLGGSGYSWATVANLGAGGGPSLVSANWCAIECPPWEGTVGVLLNNSGGR